MPVVLLPEEAALALQRGWVNLAGQGDPPLENGWLRQWAEPESPRTNFCSLVNDVSSVIQDKDITDPKRPRLDIEENTPRLDGDQGLQVIDLGWSQATSQ